MQIYVIKETWWFEGIGLHNLHVPLYELIWILEIRIYNLLETVPLKSMGTRSSGLKQGSYFSLYLATHRLSFTRIRTPQANPAGSKGHAPRMRLSSNEIHKYISYRLILELGKPKDLAFMDKKCAIYHKLGVVPGILRNTEGLSWHTVDLRKLFTILFGSILLIARRNKPRAVAHS
jgi:hypothetical protein